MSKDRAEDSVARMLSSGLDARPRFVRDGNDLIWIIDVRLKDEYVLYSYNGDVQG